MRVIAKVTMVINKNNSSKKEIITRDKEYKCEVYNDVVHITDNTGSLILLDDEEFNRYFIIQKDHYE